MVINRVGEHINRYVDDKNVVTDAWFHIRYFDEYGNETDVLEDVVIMKIEMANHSLTQDEKYAFNAIIEDKVVSETDMPVDDIEPYGIYAKADARSTDFDYRWVNITKAAEAVCYSKGKEIFYDIGDYEKENDFDNLPW